MVKLLAKEGRIKKERKRGEDYIEISIRKNDAGEIPYLDERNHEDFETYSLVSQRCEAGFGRILPNWISYILDSNSIKGSHISLRFSYVWPLMSQAGWDYKGILAISENEEEAREEIFKDMASQIKRLGEWRPQVEPEVVIHFEEGRERLEEILMATS